MVSKKKSSVERIGKGKGGKVKVKWVVSFISCTDDMRQCIRGLGLRRMHQVVEREDTPAPLGMPLQFMVTSTAVQRGHKYPEKARDVNFNPVGQIVGRMNKVRPVRDVIYDLVEECIEASDRLARLMGTSEPVS